MPGPTGPPPPPPPEPQRAVSPDRPRRCWMSPGRRRARAPARGDGSHRADAGAQPLSTPGRSRGRRLRRASERAPQPAPRHCPSHPTVGAPAPPAAASSAPTAGGSAQEAQSFLAPRAHVAPSPPSEYPPYPAAPPPPGGERRPLCPRGGWLDLARLTHRPAPSAPARRTDSEPPPSPPAPCLAWACPFSRQAAPARAWPAVSSPRIDWLGGPPTH
eukprot:scaffold6618_cov139-Isochrysis_galbana.AAC.11